VKLFESRRRAKLSHLFAYGIGVFRDLREGYRPKAAEKRLQRRKAVGSVEMGYHFTQES
jgi:hypothetical protein